LRRDSGVQSVNKWRAGRHLGVHRTDHGPVALESAQREGEHALGDARDAPLQPGESQPLTVERRNDQQRAIALHLSRGEARLIGLNIALLALAGAAIWLATAWL
jgi:hypothetical protein